MTDIQYKELVEKLGKESADKIKEQAKLIEDSLNAKYAEMTKGMVTPAMFEEYKKELLQTELKSINEKLQKAEDVAKEQGVIINTLKETGGRVTQKTLQDFFSGNIKAKDEKGVDIDVPFMEKMHAIRDARSGFIEITASDFKAAGVTSVSGSIAAMTSPPGSPYAPGIGGPELELFDIATNPNFIINHVNVGRTNQFRLAWLNEIDYQGTPGTNIAEGGAKPLTQHRFQVEFSTAKKAAAYIELTEEFDTDVPGLATAVRRLLGIDVIRAWDDQIQTDVLAVARPYEITALNGQIQEACGWDAILAMIGQVGSYNFTPDTVAMNYLTDVLLESSKDNNAAFLLPPFGGRIQSMMVFANKLLFKKVLVGDLKQYNVDIYKDFALRVGWINDNFINNKFCVLGELRYHSYISDTRKKAICYDDIYETMTTIDGGSVSGF
jgi:hypothetical protein